MKLISFKFSGFSGDVIHYLAGIKQVCESQGAKAELYLWLDQIGHCYPGAEHPYEGKMINQYAFDMLEPLLIRQSYIHTVAPWKGEKIIVDMDRIRQKQVAMPYGSLSHWIGMEFSDMQTDLSKKWIGTDPNSEYRMKLMHEKILINRTSRYRMPYVSYYFLKDYANKLVFVGLEKEHEDFQKTWQFELPFIKADNFHDLALYMKACKFFIGNQSVCFAIAEGLKIPRILEVCEYAPNVHPIGDRAHYFMFQEGLMYLVDKLNKEL